MNKRFLGTPLLLAALALGGASAATAGESTFYLKAAPNTGAYLGWFQGNSDGSKISFYEQGRSYPAFWITRNDSGPSHETYLTLGHWNSTYTCKVNGYFTGYSIDLALRAVRVGGRIEGQEKVTIKLASGKPRITITHLSGPVVARVVDDNTIEMVDP